MEKKAFVFLYPQEDILSFEISRSATYFIDEEADKTFLQRFMQSKSKSEAESIREEAKKEAIYRFRAFYSEKINKCIDERYRTKRYTVNYAIFDGSNVSNVMDVHKQDKVIYVGMSAITHRTKRADNTYPYPDPDYLIDQMMPVDNLMIGGFHIWDCVQKVAKRSHERGIKTLVDEDLTELFSGRLNDPNFRTDTFPTYNPRKHGTEMFIQFMKARKAPWHYKKY